MDASKGSGHIDATKGSSRPIAGGASSTNMTMIATVEHPALYKRVLAYVGTTLSAVALPQIVDGDTLLFLTIGSDLNGEVTFVLEQEDGLVGTARTRIPYQPDAHYGSLRQPVMLALESTVEGGHSVVALPSVFTDRVTFAAIGSATPHNAHMSVRIYSVQGKQVATVEGSAPQLLWTDCAALPAGVYFATITYNGTTTTLKLIKK